MSKERDEFVGHLVKALPGKPVHVVAEAARLFMRYARTHQRLAELECNGPGDYVSRIPYPRAGEIYAEHQAMVEKKTAAVEARAKKLAESLGMTLDCQGDPRGYTMKLQMPNGAWNTMGGQQDGYGIPS